MWTTNRKTGYYDKYNNLSTMFHDCSQKNYLNISLSKTFLNEKLQVKLAGKHLLNRRMILYDGRINNIYFWQNEDQDQRHVSLSVVYRFNNYSKKYKGQSAADDVLNRL
jgi:hypothetical protein